MRKPSEWSAGRILGGAFGLELPADFGGAAAPFFGPEAQYFLSARCALLALCAAHRPGTAWLPSYLCGSIREPFVRSRVPIRYYGLDESLRVSGTDWTQEIRAGDLVLVIHYFGFPNATFPFDGVLSRGALLVEDASQALFLPRQFRESVSILYSPRKFLGVPDGGVMLSDGGSRLAPDSLDEPPRSWWRSAVAMALKRREFDLTGRPNDWHKLFQRVEATFPVGPYRASDLSRMLISSADFDEIRKRRRANYARLLELLGQYALFPELAGDVVPLGFPVRVEPGIRNQVLWKLHHRRIYAPLHWPINGVVPESFHPSHGLASSCLTLICDQRCSLDDMDRQAGVFLAAAARRAAV
ncbi:MAG: hypothetical protein LAP38_21125 [Acidobacteriia bacterium]|nr:hypothetical protein [Terriglobia bacterium]